MRFLMLPVSLLLLVLVVVLLVYAFRGGAQPGQRPGQWPGQKALPEPRWETHTESGDGRTTVVVRRVSGTPGGPVAELDRQVVRTIPDDAEDWDIRYHEAMAEARSRVAALTSEAD